MTIEIKVPVLPESVADATLSCWHKKVGDFVKAGESLIDLETDKVMLEVPAPESGKIESIKKQEGDTVLANDVLAILDTSAVMNDEAKVTAKSSGKVELSESPSPSASTGESVLSPSVRRFVGEKGIEPSAIHGSGKKGRILKEDAIKFEQKSKYSSDASPSISRNIEGRLEERVPMSRLRARVAQRLLEVQQQSALLTTFNEINMQPVMDLRARYKVDFEKKHGVRLGFMSFFVKAAVAALKRFPVVNASIEGQDICYHGYFDIGIAIASPRGLVVPIIRDADSLSMAEIEQSIRHFSKKASEGKLTLEDMQGGTFTLTNGGVFGSMLSTPIINPPQSAILGMHNIVKRPVVLDDQIVIRPVMYVALSYDHRIIDGSDSVQFLVAIKSLLEDPSRLILDV